MNTFQKQNPPQNHQIPQIPFYFIRHGQTDWNLKEMWQGWTDIPLNETGHEQARGAVSALQGKGITRIISSPLVRAHKTAEIINEHLSVSPPDS